MKTLEVFGKRIRELRTQAGLSQQELADKASVSHTYISHIERGKKRVSAVAVCNLADALEAEHDPLLEISASMKYSSLMDLAEEHIVISRLLRRLTQKALTPQQLDAVLAILEGGE